MKKVFFIVALLAVTLVSAQAQKPQAPQGPSHVPAYKGLIERVQPNGDTLRTFLRGDEHKHWMMMEDGWQIIETSKGWFKYAKTNRKGETVSSRRKAHNADKRSKCETKWLNKHGIKKQQ